MENRVCAFEKDLISYGEVLWDTYGNKRVLAGAPLNTASIAAKIGLRTGFISAVGKNDADSIGEEILKRDVCPYLQSTSQPTGKSVVTLGKGKKPSFEIDEVCSFDFIKHNKELENAVMNAEFFHFGTLCQRNEVSRETLMTLLSETGATRVYDVNLRGGINGWKQIVKDSLKKTEILKANEDELAALKKLFDAKDIIKYLFKNYEIKSIFVTLGPKGAYYYNRKEKLFVKAPGTEVVDTTGCGDAFIAGMIFGIAKGFPAGCVLRQAVYVASGVAEHKGAYHYTRNQRG
jgi:fructokinase